MNAEIAVYEMNKVIFMKGKINQDKDSGHETQILAIYYLKKTTTTTNNNNTCIHHALILCGICRKTLVSLFLTTKHTLCHRQMYSLFACVLICRIMQQIVEWYTCKDKSINEYKL